MRWMVVALLAAAPALAQGSDAPQDYAVRVGVTPAPGAAVQRLALPPRVLAALRRSDGADLRIFDASGARAAMARAPARAAGLRRTRLAVLPILGAADAMQVTGVSLKLDDEGRARVARVDGTVAASQAARVAGVLLDARALDGTPKAVVVDAALPAGQPVTLTVEASDDLKAWRPVAEKVVYRTTAATAPETLALDGMPAARRWLRLSWQAGSRLLSPVTIAGATLVDAASGGAAALPSIAVRLPRAVDAHAIEMALPFATPLAGIALVPARDAIVPVRVLGRDDAEQPWRLLGAGDAARVGGVARGGMIALSGATPRLLRIEADARSDGFADVPAARVFFVPSDIVFAAAAPPLTLAAGRAEAGDAFLPLASVTGGVEIDRLPEATLADASAAPLVLEAPVRGGGRRILLWAVLLAATALLGWMAWRLARGAS